jgi:hypothetical protein
MGNGNHFSPKVEERAVWIVVGQAKNNVPTRPAIYAFATIAESFPDWMITLLYKS